MGDLGTDGFITEEINAGIFFIFGAFMRVIGIRL